MTIKINLDCYKKNTARLIFLLCLLVGISFELLAQKQVTHLVLFKFKPGITKKDERYKAALEKLKELPKKITDMEDCSMGENFSQRPIAYDFGLSVVFSSKKKLENYLRHPAHLDAVEAWKEIADWHIVDFEDLEE